MCADLKLVAPTRLGLLLNPKAGANARRPEERRALARAFAPLGEVVELDEAGALVKLFTRWRAEGKELVALCGGDGTMHRALNAMRRAWAGAPLPALLLLHGGTTGIAAKAVGGASPLAAITALGEALSRGAPLGEERLTTLDFGGHLGFNFGLGLFASIPAEFARRGERGAGALKRFAVDLLKSALFGGELASRAVESFSGEVALDGARVVAGRAAGAPLAGLYASALDRNALADLRGFYRAARPEGGFRALLVDAGPRQILGGLVPFARGWSFGVPDGVSTRPARELVIRPRAPTYYMADGEFYPLSGPLRLTAGPCLRIVRPPCDLARR
jgi:diacylglycerol kinase family enzyme